MNKSKATIKLENQPQKKKRVQGEGSPRNMIIAASIGAVLVISLILLVFFDYLYAAPCVTIDGESYNVNDIEVRYNVYNAEAQIQMDAAYAYSLGMYSQPKDYWDLEGVRDNALSISRDATTKYLLMYREAVKNGVTLTDEEKETVTKQATDFYNAMSDEHKKRAKFSLEELIEYKLEMEVANKYIEEVKASYNVSNETLETPIDKAGYDEMKFKVIVAPITDSTSDAEADTAKKLDEKTIATYKEKMEGYLKEAKAGKDLSELVADEDSYIYQYMETTLIRGTETYQTLLDALEPLENGELCDSVIEDDKALYVVQMVDDKSTESYDTAVEDAVLTKEEELFNADLNKLLETYNVKIGSGWDKIEIGNVVVRPGEDVSEFTVGLADDSDEEEDTSDSPVSSVVPEESASPKED